MFVQTNEMALSLRDGRIQLSPLDRPHFPTQLVFLAL